MGAKQRIGDDLLIELWCKFFFFHFHFPVPRVRSLILGPRSLCPVLPSAFSLRRCLFSVLLFPVSRPSFSASRSPRSSFFFILFFYKLLNNEAIVWKYIISPYGSGRVKTNDSVTLWFQRQNLFLLLCMLKYISQESVLCSFHRREHLQLYSAKGGKL